MGRRGPKPTPTAILEKRGSWRADAREGEPLPDPLLEVPDPPDHLSDIARRIWQESAPAMVGIGTLTTDDLRSFERYCRAFALWSKKARELEEAAEITESMTKGLVNLDNQLRRLEAAFGKNPADRAGLSLPDRKTAADPFQKPKLKVG